MSSSIDHEILAEHASEAAFLWTLRDRAARAPTHDLGALTRLDARIEAHVDALRVAGGAGHEAADAAAEDGRGEAFVAAVLAIERGDVVALHALVERSDDPAGAARAAVSAGGWCSAATVRTVMLPALNARDPFLRHLALSACAAHRIDPEAALPRCIADDDPRVQARALRAVGELARVELQGEVIFGLSHDDPERRYWAARSASFFRVAAAAPVLFELVLESPPHARGAAAMAMRCADASQAAVWLRGLASRGDRRIAIEAAAARGDPAHVPLLLERIDHPEFARSVGAALATITGVDLESEGLAIATADNASTPSDDPRDERVSLDPDEALPQPDAVRTRSWWERHAGRFAAGSRLLLGHPMELPWLKEVLRAGTQPLRHAAALELSLRQRRHMLFEVRAPAWRQQRSLAPVAALAENPKV